MLSFDDVKKNARRQMENDKKREDSKKSDWESVKKQARDHIAQSGMDFNSWFSGVHDLSRKAGEYFSRDGYIAPNTAFDSDIEKYLANAGAVKSYINANQGAFANHQEVSQAYEDAVSYLTGLKEGIAKTNAHFSQFKDEDEYNTAKANWQDYYDRWGHRADADPDFGISAAKRDYVNPTEDDLLRYDVMMDNKRWHTDAEGVRRDAYGNVVYQEGVVMNLDGDTILHPMRNDEKYVVKDPVGFFLSMDKEQREGMALEDWAYESERLGPLLRKATDQHWELLSESDLNMYYYLLDTQGLDKAMEYIDYYAENRNAQWGASELQRIQNIDGDFWRAGAYGMLAMEAGSESWATGLANALGAKIQPTSGTQYASTFASQSLDGFGKYAYDATFTVGNMLPSIVISSGLSAAGAGGVVAKGAGALAMGTSAGGHAYAQGLEDGMAEGQAKNYGFLVGASETTLQTLLGGIGALGGVADDVLLSKAALIDNALLRVAAKLGINIGSEIMEEELQLFLEPLFKTILTGEGYNAPKINEMVETAIVTALSTFALEGGNTVVGDVAENQRAKDIYGTDPGALVNEALEINPDNAFAQKMQGRLDNGKNLSGGQLNRLVKQNEAALTAQDMSSIQSATESRLTELGETGDVAAIASALTKQAAGQKLTRAEQQIIASSKYGQRVANELNTENIKSGGYSSEWAQKLDTQRINAQEYSRLVEAAQLPQETAEVTGDQVATQPVKAAQVPQAATVDVAEAPAANDQQVTGKLTGKKSLQVAEESTATEEAEAKTTTLEDASKKYGAQAQAMIHTYVSGQDVVKYDQGYQVAYDMGKSGVDFSYLEKSPVVSYLTDIQKQLAYEAGQAASNTEAQALDAKNKAAANGKTGRRKGTVRGEGVTISDLKQTFNDTQGKAYKYLSTVAEATGIDIVLYRSEAGPDGKFQGAQGRYRRSEPGTIYIDLNAGLSDIKNADDLAKYAMLRTFAHEFTHFIEKWNPIQYNELRKVVFDTLTQRGENVHDLIEDKQSLNPGMSYDKAGREVVAEAMTDILPDANFVQELAENHKTIFQKLLEKLKEFVDNLRDYFNSIGYNSSKEANALKEQVGETVKYLDSIVQLFDKAAVQAVENYQLTVAVDAVTGETSIVETKVETTVEENTPADGETTPAVEVTEEIPFDKRTLSLLKSTGRVGAVDFDGQKYVTNGYIMLPTTSAGFKYAHVELNATTMNTEVVRKAFENASTLVTKAPMEGKAGTDAVYIFDVGGKKLYFKKKLFSHIDGGLLYAGQYNGGGVIKSVNEDGSIKGYLLGMKIKDESSITDLKPSKLKKMQALIDAQTAVAEVGALDSARNDDVQYQGRKYADNDPYPTADVHWGIEAGIITEAEARAVWKAIADSQKRKIIYPKTVSGEIFVANRNFLMVVYPDYQHPRINTIYEFAEQHDLSVIVAGEEIINAKGIQSEERKAIDFIKIVYGEGYVTRHTIGDYRANARKIGRGEGKNSGTTDSGNSEQHQQSRDYLSEGESYDNRGIRADAEGYSVADGESSGEAIYGRGDRADGRRTQKNKEWGNLPARRRQAIVKAVSGHINSSPNYNEIRQYLAHTIGKSVADMNLRDKETAIEKLSEALYASITDLNNSRPYVEQRWSFLGNVRPIIEAIYGENVQFQQRTNTLTDREVLAMAANQVKVADLTDAEKDALNIFQQRLSKLESLQTERAEQGRLYKEQQFGAKVDRAKAAETLNRMHVLDGQIQKASAEVLTVEEKTVLKRVLQKARTVVEQQEREHGQEILKRWRDRRNNADAIKKYRDRLRGDVDELTNWVLHPDNKNVVKHIPDALKSTVLPFLKSINFMSKRSLAGGNHTQADKALMEQTRRLAKVMENTVDIDEMYSNYTDLPPDFMRNLRSFMDTAQAIVDSNSGDFIINQMTAEELQKLSKVVRTLKKYIMTMNRFHVNSMFKHVYDAGNNSIHFLSLLKPAENTGAVSQFLLWQQMRPAYAFERFGDGGIAIYDGLRRGQATLAFNTKKIMEFSEKAYTTAEVKAWDNQVKTIRLGDGRTIKMRVSQIMSLYELSKREQAQGHIFGEGIRVATFKSGNKKISDVGQTITHEELNTILQELTPRQKEVADKLQQFMQQQGGEWGNYVTVARFGEKQFGEENYFPINSDGRHLQVDADEKPGAAALYALLNMGFTKQTQEKAKNRLIVYSIFDVFSNHMASMAQYNAFALPVVDALKWFNYQQIAVEEDGSKTILGSVREQMDRAFGVPEENRPGSGRRGYAQNFVINIIKALNGTEAQGTAYDSLGLQTLHHYNRAQVAFNFRVVVQQPLAITRAAQLLDYGSIIKGMKLQPAAIQKNIQEMQRYSGIAAWKSLGFYDVNISRGLTSIIKHDDTTMDKITDVGMWCAEKADTLTWAAIWSAAKEEVIRKQKLTPKSEGFYGAVTKLFEEVIYKTQVVDSVLTKNEFMRDKGFWARAVGSFKSEPTTTASMLLDSFDKLNMDMQRGMSFQQAWKKNSKNIVRTAYVYGLGAAILAAVQAVADAFRDDDDYQKWYEKWLEAFGGNLVDELMPFNKLPILSEFYDLAKELLSVFGVDTYGNPPQSVLMQWYDSLVKGVEILYDKISGEDTSYTWYGGAYKLLQAASGMTGLPMASATREIVTAWNNIVGAMAPSLKVKTYDPGKKNEIKYAYQDGYLTAEEAIDQLLQHGVVDTEDEAYFLVQGWEAGEGYSRYDAIFDAVRNGGNFNAAMRELTSHGYAEKDVLSQVKGKIGEWYKGGEITKQQATDMLTKYIGGEEVQNTIDEWTFEVEHPGTK